MSTINVEAIILSRRNIGEADRLLSAYSRQLGQIRILAKGSRKLKSKMASHIEPFCVGKYFLATGKTFYILAGAESTNTNTVLSKDIELYKDASYVCELLQMVSVENQASEDIFIETKHILSIFHDLPKDKRKILLRYFEYFLLSRTGYEPDYMVCKNCQNNLPKQERYKGDYEGVYCDRCPGSGAWVSLSTLKLLRLFRSEKIGDILAIKNVSAQCAGVKDVTYPYLCDILPKIPNSENL
jgi:DNA repair protein RecO (recombination protein O)